MKTLKTCFVAVIATATLALFATTGFAHATESVGTNVSAAGADTIIVPDNVRISFQTKYPQAVNPMWYKYQDMKDDYTDTYIGYYDPNNYYVTYRTNDVDYISWYSPTGEWVMTTNTISNDKLPAAALKALQQSYNGYTVVKVDEEHYNGGTRYDVKLRKGEEKLKIHVTADGQVLKAKDKQ
jgi:hypothetical protein